MYANSFVKGRIHYNGRHYILSPSFCKPCTKEERIFSSYNSIVKRNFYKLKRRSNLLGSEIVNKLRAVLRNDYAGGKNDLYLNRYIKKQLSYRVDFLCFSEKFSQAKKLYDTLDEQYRFIIKDIWRFNIYTRSRSDIYRELKLHFKKADYKEAFQRTVKHKLKREKQFEEFKKLLELKGYFFETEDSKKALLDDMNKFITNWYKRKERFEKKAKLPLNNFNYFATFTYSDEKTNEEDFRKKLMKCLQNLHTRRGWKYCLVWERGESDESDFERIDAEGRLHAHALICIPEGQLAGEFHTISKWNKKHHKHYDNNSHTLFDKFGLNDFQALDFESNFIDDIINYITKYTFKSGEKIKYSRGTFADILKDTPDLEISSKYQVFGFLEKFVLYDDVKLVLKDGNPVLISPRTQT